MINNLEVVIYLRELGFDIQSEFEMNPRKVNHDGTNADNYISFNYYDSDNLISFGSFLIDVYLSWTKQRLRNEILDKLLC